MIMNNGESAQSLDINQIKWALRNGKMNIYSNSVAENQLVVTEPQPPSAAESPPICSTVLGEMKDMENMLNQQISLFRNEFGVFIQAQVNHEKILRMSETEWQKRLEAYEIKFLTEIRETRETIIGEFTTYFQLIAEQLQQRDKVIDKQVELLKAELAELQKNKEVEAQWNQKMEDCQLQLIDCMQHIHGVLEQISIHSIDSQKQENSFTQEIGLLKEELAVVRKALQFRESIPPMVKEQQDNSDVVEPECQQVEEVKQDIQNDIQPAIPLEVLLELDRKNKKRRRKHH